MDETNNGSGLPLKAPFPYFGGKARVAVEVWRRFGDPANYVEPFAGSLAVLLSRPHKPRTETVNDVCGLLCNFWRAVQADPDAVARWADHPVSECDLHARHRWLVSAGRARVELLKTDPDFYDPKVAGWWVWGACCWIGSGWCRDLSKKLPHIGNAGRGVHRPSQQLPYVSTGAQGINAVANQCPHLDPGGRGVLRASNGDLYTYFHALSARLRRVRVCCGDWTRVLGPTPTLKNGLTAVFLDPPYSDEDRQEGLYSHDDVQVAHAVREWALENGDNPEFRIALAGYDGEHEMPSTWECLPWKARGGYGSQGNGQARENAGRERLWFSPHCIRREVVNEGLFAEMLA